jgi:LacI family transcriptional regulator
MQVSLEDVAKRAGVARSTVSRVLNGSGGATISQATQERVRRLAQELGYRPNRLAQRLRKGQADTVGLIVPHLRNPFFVEVVVWCQRFLSERGLNMVLYPTMLEDWGGATEYQLSQWAVDGILYYGGPTDSFQGLLGKSGSASLPTVYLGHLHESDPEAIAVALAKEELGHLAGAHLSERGHARRNAGVWYLSPPQERAVIRDGRAYGLECFCQENEIPFSVVTSNDTSDGLRGLGFSIGLQILALPTQARPGGIFCHNDLIAVGCLCALRRGGAKIPEEIALVGCDALPEGRFQELSLTTLRQPISTMCQQAVERLIALVQGEPGPQPRQIILTPELVQGHTT